MNRLGRSAAGCRPFGSGRYETLELRQVDVGLGLRPPEFQSINKVLTMKKFLQVTAALALCAAIGTTCFAAVYFDSEAGTGFVGKGDVQLAFGWNNKQLQDNAERVSFTYEVEASYTLVCKRGADWNGQGQEQQTFGNKVISVDADVAYETRSNKKGAVTGYLLSGFGVVLTDGEGCPSGYPVEVSRAENANPGQAVGLFVHYEDMPSVAL
jgi:hypothetical protein